MARYRQDPDIKAMTLVQARRALARVRHELRQHKKADNNERCWRNDNRLYDRTLPEGSEGAGRMRETFDSHLKKCRNYVCRQVRAGKCDPPGEPNVVIVPAKAKSERRAFQLLRPGDRLLLRSCPICFDERYNGIQCQRCGHVPMDEL